MKVAYGSENGDGAPALLPIPVQAAASRQRTRKKNMLAAFGVVTLVLGGAFAAFQATSSSPSAHEISTGGKITPSSMDLSADLSMSAFNVPEMLLPGSEILLRIRGKNSLCVDDGGAAVQGEKKFSAQPCNPKNVNQLFVYDRKTYQLRSARKNNLCMDDGGASNAGGSNVWLWGCDPDSVNQRFVFDEKTLMFRNPMKKNLCLDDGSGMIPGQTPFVLYDCWSDSPNQHFEIVSQTQLAAEKSAIMDAVADGSKFIMRIPGKNNLCVDDGGGQTIASTKFHVWTCDTSSMNQVFKYDATTKRIRSVQKQGLCVDDGGGANAAQSNFVLWPCDPANKNQDFVYDPKTLLVRNPNKDNLCMDDGAAYSAGAGPKFVLWYCDVFNPNQHFEFVLVTQQIALDDGRSHMTKLEFYYEIKNHYTPANREALFRFTPAEAHLRSTVLRARKQNWLDCIKAASKKFGGYGSESRDVQFHNALNWMRDECFHK